MKRTMIIYLVGTLASVPFTVLWVWLDASWDEPWSWVILVTAVIAVVLVHDQLETRWPEHRPRRFR